MNYKMTIIIPLFGRIFYTKLWIKENIKNDYFYIFADGSLDDEAFNLFKKIKLNNVKYIRYSIVCWDNFGKLNSGVYFVKMVAGSYVDTQKLMLVK